MAPTRCNRTRAGGRCAAPRPWPSPAAGACLLLLQALLLACLLSAAPARAAAELETPLDDDAEDSAPTESQAGPEPADAPGLPAGKPAEDAAPALNLWRDLEPGLRYAEFPLPGGGSLAALRIDPAHFEFVLCARSQAGGPPRPLGQWGELEDLTAAINASMYLPDSTTSTGYMRFGEHVNNGRMVRRFGAFFVAGPDDPALPPATILERDAPDLTRLLGHYRLVIQNYRMVTADGRVLWEDGGPLYAISAVACDGGGQVLFLHCRHPMEASTFARQLLRLPLDVRTVMYVEGGGQAGLLVRSQALRRELGGLHPGGLLVTGDLRAPLPNVLGVRRKNTLQPAPIPAE